MKLLVRGLARSTSEETLRKLFESIGPVQSCTIVIDEISGKSKGFGFVDMPKAGQAKIAIKELNNKEVDGSKVRVKKAEPPKPAAEAEKDVTPGSRYNRKLFD